MRRAEALGDDDSDGHVDAEHIRGGEAPGRGRGRMTLAEFRNVSFAYPATEERRARPFALADLSFEIAPGEIVGVIGPNSSGKTTLIRLLTRVLEPASGEIRLEGVPVRRLSRTDLARRVAVVPQGILPQFPFTVGELALMGRYPHDPGRYFESPRDRSVARAAMEATGGPEAVLDETLLAAVFGCAVVVDKNETTRRPVVRLTWRIDAPSAGSADRREVRETK